MTWVDFNSEDLGNLQAAMSTFISGLLSQTESPNSAFKETIEIKYKDRKTIKSETVDSECLRLGPLPYRPGDTSKQVEIYVQFGLTIKARDTNSGRRYEIVKSSTEMVYLDVTEGEDGVETRERVQGLHFDFELNSEASEDGEDAQTANHPVFHAQYNPNCVDTAAIERWDPEPHSVNYPEYPRIPCAPFDIVSVGYMVLNDHLPKRIRDHRGWPSEMLHENLPRFPKKAFEFTPQGGRHMVPEWWYVPSSVDGEGQPLLDPNYHRPI